jgi:hypothetical protein
MIDKRAIKILFNSFWDPKTGWKKSTPSQEDFNYAKDAGVMFDPINVNHDQITNMCVATVKETSKDDVVRAFLSSLSNRDLSIRSALGSYAVGMKLQSHGFTENSNSSFCSICGLNKEPGEINLNILSFERHKFGGVRHLKPTYIWFDLNCLNKEIENESLTNESSILINILNCLSSAKLKKLSDAEKSLKSIVKGNKNEREGIISILGYCGILNVPGFTPFFKDYTNFDERAHSSYAKSDWPFPADLWLPQYGLNSEAIDYWFNGYV